MKAKTEDFLYHLLWFGDQMMRPTFRNLTGSFEAWAYRNGLSRQLSVLERRLFLESKVGVDSIADTELRMVRLTKAGRLHALGGRDPEVQWRRPWDGRWRMVLFDLPVTQKSARDRLRFHLRKRWFGRLQDSVWITPDPLKEEQALLVGTRAHVGSLLMLEARPCAGESDKEIVASAWDFSRINEAYAEHAEILAARPIGPFHDEPSARTLRKWSEQERVSWEAALVSDPLLPERLLPPNYTGRKCWNERVKTLRKVADQVQPWP